MGNDLYILAGGGTGGHLYPGLAVAERLRELRPSARIVLACSSRPIDRRILDPTPYAVVVQPVRPMPTGLGGWLSFARSYLSSAAQARQMVRDLRPAAVLGLGGFAAGPILCRAAKCGVRCALLNPDAVPGRANRLLARRVEAIFTQFASTAGHFGPRCRPKVHHVGCPVRAAFGQVRRAGPLGRAEARRHFGLHPDRKTFFINGGSLGAASINEAVRLLLPDLGALGGQWQVLHVTGHDKAAPVQAPPGLLLRTLDYCQRMDLAYAAADLALSRAGAVTIAELVATGIPAVLMPYPYHADQHQRLNAQALADAGAAVICPDARQAAANAAALRQVLLPILREPERLEAMRSAASAGGPPRDAALAVAQWLANEGR